MRKRRLQLWYCMFILPSLISLVVIVVVPFLNGIRYSFTSWNGIMAPSFTGLENYEKVFSDAQFWSSMWLMEMQEHSACLLFHAKSDRWSHTGVHMAVHFHLDIP